MSPSDRPIFIVGCPRSGTTLFRTMLHAHPRIAVPPETRFVMQAYLRRYNIGDLTDPAQREYLARWIVEREESRFSVLRVDGDDVIRQIIEGPPTLGSALGIVFRTYSAKNGKVRWGDKRPAYYSFIDELDNLFPDAQFVHMVRDGRACVASLKRTPWFDHEPIPCMATWMMAIDCSRESGARLGRERFLEVKYEDLVTAPESEIRRVCDFLEEEYAPQMCAPEKIADRVNPFHYEQRNQISEGIYTKSMDAWRDQLEPWEIATFEIAAGDRLAHYGYAPSGVEGDVPRAQLRALVGRHRQLRRTLRRRRRVDYRRLMAADHPVGALLTAGQREAAARPVHRPLSARLRRGVRPVVRRVRPLTAAMRRLADRGSDAAVAAQQAVEGIEET
jgi:hypothetical protein